MIRLEYLLRRRTNLSLAEFHGYWRERHGPLVAKNAVALRIKKYVQVHTDDPLNEALREPRGAMEPYDGAAEVWWEKPEDLLSALETTEGRQASQELLDDEGKFIDLPRSPLWLAYELPQVNPAPETIVAREESSVLRLIYIFHHLPNLSLAEAQLYWRMHHSPKVRRGAPAAAIRRYIQVHMFESPLAEGLRNARGTLEPAFTGHAELWWERSELLAALGTPEGQAAFGSFLEDERNFIDFRRSALWLAKEHVFINR